MRLLGILELSHEERIKTAISNARTVKSVNNANSSQSWSPSLSIVGEVSSNKPQVKYGENEATIRFPSANPMSSSKKTFTQDRSGNVDRTATRAFSSLHVLLWGVFTASDTETKISRSLLPLKASLRKFTSHLITFKPLPEIERCRKLGRAGKGSSNTVRCEHI